ncbi:MAG: magnesium transporter [Candidatus Bathyarchaeota archaeon]|nr:magnesium transporter [Candidatus Bathyarchaeota archaeon]MDH5495512.1 magnesium transporter [Candidatus Bathyarchaeota archaeon]
MPNKRYPPNTAGSRIITAFPQVRIGEKIRDVEKMLLDKANKFDTIDYVYVVDDSSVLKGVVSIKEVHASEKDVSVKEIMKKKLVVIHPLMHQERIVYLALSNKIKAIPVVDREKRLLGIVPYDTILQIFNEEVREDFFKFGGIFHKVGKEYTTIKSSALTMVKTRLPWIIIGVLGGTITASIITSFEHVLNTLLALAAFAPVLAYLSDAVGTQSETLAVRSIALDPKLSLKSYFIREFAVALSLALACGLLLSTIAFVGWQNSTLGLIVGLSMFLSIISAVLISTGFPFLFKKANLDPAVGSGPFATMISDAATVTIYFTVASILLASFGLM